MISLIFSDGFIMDGFSKSVLLMAVTLATAVSNRVLGYLLSKSLVTILWLSSLESSILVQILLHLINSP